MKGAIAVLILIVLGGLGYWFFSGKEGTEITEKPTDKPTTVDGNQPKDPKNQLPTEQPKVETKKPDSNIEELLTQSQFSKALKAIDQVGEDQRDYQWKTQKAVALIGLGERQKAQSWLEQVLKKATHHQKPELYMMLAEVLIDDGKIKESQNYLKKISVDHPDSTEARQAGLKLIQYWKRFDFNQVEPDALIEDNKALTGLLHNTVDDNIKADIVEVLHKLNQRLFYAPQEVEGVTQYHKVKYGENLSLIAKQYKVYRQRIQRVNNIPRPNLIKVGQKLKVIKGRVKVVVNRKKFLMNVYLGNYFFRQFKVGIGKDAKTPKVETRVSQSLRQNPDWQNPNGKLVPFGHDDNPLGTRWIGLDYGMGYGIHGTKQPDSIGKASSNGCIRMLNEDVEFLYDFIQAGDVVIFE